jgi:hypothetical protein
VKAKVLNWVDNFEPPWRESQTSRQVSNEAGTG